MKILTKLMLASAVMVTSGFADPGDTILGTNKDSAELNGVFGDTNYVAKNGGAINVLNNTTVPAGRSIKIESAGVGTVDDGVVLSNEGTVAMHWDETKANQGLVAGSGKIDQVIVAASPATVYENFDEQGDATWYVYKCWNKNAGEWCTLSPQNFYNPQVFPTNYNGWYCTWCYTEALSDYIVYELNTNKFEQVFTEPKNGSIVINNVEKLEYIAANSAVLDADTTNLTGTDLNGKNPKLVAVSENFAFNPPIPSTIADVTLNGGTDLLDSPKDDAITNDKSLGDYFSGFGVSFKKDAENSSDLKYVSKRSVIDAIASGTADDAVLLNQTDEIDVDDTAEEGDSIDIAANLHSIGNSDGVTFSGEKALDLSGNNSLLKMTANCPVKISGTSSMPGNSTFKNRLTIAESVTTPSGITTVTGDFKVESEKTFTVQGKLIVGTPIAI